MCSFKLASVTTSMGVANWPLNRIVSVQTHATPIVGWNMNFQTCPYTCIISNSGQFPHVLSNHFPNRFQTIPTQLRDVSSMFKQFLQFSDKPHAFPNMPQTMSQHMQACYTHVSSLHHNSLIIYNMFGSFQTVQRCSCICEYAYPKCNVCRNLPPI